MGLRFRRRLKIGPGVNLNIGKSGPSLSVGTRGAHVSVGHGHVRETVGIPGTGLSATETQSRSRPRSKRKPITLGHAFVGSLGFVVILSISGVHSPVWLNIAFWVAFIGGFIGSRLS